MSYQQQHQGAPDGSRRQQQATPFPLLGTSGAAAAGRAPAAAVYGMPQQYGQQQVTTGSRRHGREGSRERIQ